MAGAPRREIVAEGEIGAYHCMARCVRRAYLCGKDKLTGKDFSHRKDWVRTSLERLAGSFAIDVCSFAIMDNHLHVIVRQRPDVANDWSAKEITGRWRMIFGKAPKTKAEREAFDLLIDVESRDDKLVKLRRQRLASVSWFMRCLCEPIARRANKEDGCTGRFWEGRFRSQALLDEAAILACAAYVDLNPVRAKQAATPETSRNTSIFERVGERQTPSKRAEDSRDGWLAPMADQLERKKSTGRRASNEEWTSLKLDEYLSLLDWTGRQIRQDKRGAIPVDLSPILDRLKIQPAGWVEVVANFGRLFKHAAGSPTRMGQHALNIGRHWLKGIGPSRAVF